MTIDVTDSSTSSQTVPTPTAKRHASAKNQVSTAMIASAMNTHIAAAVAAIISAAAVGATATASLQLLFDCCCCCHSSQQSIRPLSAAHIIAYIASSYVKTRSREHESDASADCKRCIGH
eukprot:18004-Heterococcus_DN1.PRE.3